MVTCQILKRRKRKIGTDALRDKECTACLSHKKQAEGPLIAEKEISNISLVNLTPCQKARPAPLSFSVIFGNDFNEL